MSRLQNHVKGLLVFLCGIFLLGALGTSHANQVRLDAALNHPLVLADGSQKAYIRIGLTGFPLDTDNERAPVNVAIVIDQSSSMSGDKIARAREAAIMTMRKLNSRDIVSVITYSSTVNVLVPATKVSDKDQIERKIRAIQATGSTALFAGVSKGAEEVRKFLSKERVNRIVLISDGLANVGPSSPADLAELGDQLIREEISVTTIGLGLGYNEDLMSQLAFKSDGNHYFAEHAKTLAEIFDKEFGKAMSVVAQNVTTTIRLFPGVRPVRVLGREGVIDGQEAQVKIKELYSESEKSIVLELEMPSGENDARLDVASIKVSYDNMKSNNKDVLTSTIRARYTDSLELVAKNENAEVMEDVVMLLATETNILAMQLRDQGKQEEAKQLLISNRDYLQYNASKYDSDELKEFGATNEVQSQNLDDYNYNRTRKAMQEEQVWRVKQ
ncbi:MAG: vWA domain-containing protein [Candidatus Sumerlaeia bacterium]